jgi:pentatricopeptide repeat protein
MGAAFQKARSSNEAFGAAIDHASSRMSAGDMGASEARHAIRIFQLANMPEKCLEVIRQLQLRNIKVDTGSYTATISAYGKRKQWKQMWSLFENMKLKGIAPNVVTYNIMISACGKQRKWKDALRLLGEMEARGVERENVSASGGVRG